MDNFLFHAHSGLRWLVVAASLIAFVWLLSGLLQPRPYGENTRRIMLAWSSLLGVQWVLGIVLLVTRGTFLAHELEHSFTMTLALIMAHLYLPFKKRTDLARHRIGLMIIAGTALLIYIGVARLPQGW
jgi:uncharacterized membrane protein